MGGRRQRYDTAYLIAKGYYTEKRDRPFDAASSWGDYITSYYQDQRFTLGSGLLTNGYVQIHEGKRRIGATNAASTAPECVLQHRPIPDGWVARLRPPTQPTPAAPCAR